MGAPGVALPVAACRPRVLRAAGRQEGSGMTAARIRTLPPAPRAGARKKPQILVPDHTFVPKHEIMTKAEAEEVMERYHCKPTELPLIYVTDPAIVKLGVKPGDMIRITRDSSTAGESIYYRYVVET